MDFSVYAQPRKFVLPRLNQTEYVGGDAVLWALVGGPVFFWRKGALIGALMTALATLPLWAIDSDGYLLDAIGALAWLGTGALAPPLLAASYRRRGWVDVTGGRRPLDRDDDMETRDDPEREGLRLPPRRGRLLDLEDDMEDVGEPQGAARSETEQQKGLILPPRDGRRLLDLEDDAEQLDEKQAPRLEPEEHNGLILPPRRGRRLLDLEESDLD